MTPVNDTPVILIVDDTPSNLAVVVSLFEDRGYRVSIAQDGEEGIQRAQLLQPDLILLDVMMPGIDGFEACRNLKRENSTRDIPVIFMTSLAMPEHKVEGFRAGAVDYVTKPLQIDEVMARVDSHLKLSAAQKKLAEHNEELERRVAERTAELAAREREFRTLVENAPDEIARHDRQGRFIYINPQHEKTLGIPLADLVGKTHVECFPGIPDVVTYQARLMDVIENGRTVEYEATLPDVGDGPRYHSILLVPERGADGEIVGALAIGRDVTELKRADAAVRERELRYRQLFENSPVSIWEEDFSAVHGYFEQLRQSGVKDLSAYFDAHPEAVKHCAELVRIVDVNQAAVTLHRAQNKAELFAGIQQTFTQDSFRTFREELIGLWRGKSEMKVDAVVQTLAGEPRHVVVQFSIAPDTGTPWSRMLVSLVDITERKKVEQQLAMMGAAIDHAHEAAYFVDEHGGFFYVNEEASRMLGYSREALLGMTVMDIAPGWTPEVMMESWQAISKAGALTIEAEHRHKDGRIIPVEINITHMNYGGRAFNLAMVRDISERKRAERELHLLNRALDNAFDATYLIGEDLRLRYVNEAAVRALGYGREELLSMTLLDIDPNVTREIMREVMKRTEEVGGVPRTIESTHRRKDGTLFPIEVGATIFNYEGEKLHLTTVRDITERKGAERELHLLNRALDNAFDATYLIDTDARFRYVNEAAVRELGYSREELLSMSLFDIDPVLTRERIDDLMKQTEASGRYPGIIEMLHRRKDGTVFPVEIGATALSSGEETLHLTVVRNITERKFSEEMLAAREREFRTLVESLPDGIIRLDAEGRHLFVNEVALHSAGLVEMDLLGKTVCDLPVPGNPETLRPLLDALRRAVRSGKQDVMEFTWPNGRVSEICHIPEFDAQGAVVSVLAIGRDITERKRAEEALAAREREFRTLAENIPDTIIRYDAQARKTYVNTAVARFIGVDADALIGKTPKETLPARKADQADAYMTNLRRTLDSGEPQEIEVELHHMQQGSRVLNIRFVAERNEQGEIVGALMVGRDITAMKAIENELIEREQRYREIFDNAVEGMYLLEVTEDGRFRNLDINPALAESTGMSREAMIGRFVDDTVPEEAGKLIVEKYRRCVEAGTSITESIELDLPSGKRHYLSTMTPIRYDGRIHRLIGISRDITELKKVERALEESRAQLRGLTAKREAAREEERKYIAREVHDELGQLLTGLQLNVSVLAHKFGAKSPELRERLGDTLALTDRALAVARNVASALRPAALDMGIVSALEWLVGRFGANTGIHCEVHAADWDIQLDESQAIALFRIVQESLTNVARHAGASRVDIDIGMSGDDYSLKVRDNGAGFDGKTAKADSFGLVGMRERALLLGGEVIIDSKPGEGTEIEVRIPAHNVSGLS